jgi:hypothetical protein
MLQLRPKLQLKFCIGLGIEAVWIAAMARPTNFVVVGSYHGLGLDQRNVRNHVKLLAPVQFLRLRVDEMLTTAKSFANFNEALNNP